MQMGAERGKRWSGPVTAESRGCSWRAVLGHVKVHPSFRTHPGAEIEAIFRRGLVPP